MTDFDASEEKTTLPDAGHGPRFDPLALSPRSTRW
jgi:hypothetical protein